MYSTKEEKGHIFSDKFRIIVDSEGNATWFITRVLYSSCPIDVSNFPFDTQKCEIKFLSWTHDARAVDLVLHDKDGIKLHGHKEHSEWKLKSIISRRNMINVECCLAPYVDIVYTLEFQRKALYYTMTVISPSMLLSLIVCLSFLFPANSGERVSLVISVFLGLFVFMLIVNEHTPVTSDSVPMLTEFFNYIAVSTLLALCATAFILHLNHGSTCVPVPWYLQRIRDCVAVPVCIKKTQPVKGMGQDIQEMPLTEASTQCISHPDFLSQAAVVRRSSVEQKILNELQKLSKHLEEENIASDMREDWNYTMKVFDRLFFVIFFILFLFFSSYVFSFF